MKCTSRSLAGAVLAGACVTSVGLPVMAAGVSPSPSVKISTAEDAGSQLKQQSPEKQSPTTGGKEPGSDRESSVANDDTSETERGTSSGGATPAGEEADAVVEQKLRWRGKVPESVLRGGTLTAELRVNFNTPAGSGETLRREIVVKAEHGQFVKLPRAAREGSKLSSDRTEMTLVLSEKGGSSRVVDLPVVSAGSEGEKTRVVSTLKKTGETVRTTGVPIRVTQGMDIGFEQKEHERRYGISGLNDPDAVFRQDLPLTLSVPFGAEKINDELVFNLQLESSNQPEFLRRDVLSEYGFQPTTGQWQIPETGKTVPLPEETDIKFLGEGKYRVTMRGFPQSMLEQSLKGATGDDLDLANDRVYMLSGEFKVQIPFSDIISSDEDVIDLRARVEDSQLETADGESLDERTLANNLQSYVYTGPGAYSAAWGRANLVDFKGLRDDALVRGEWEKNPLGNGTASDRWSGEGDPLPGETLWSRVNITPTAQDSAVTYFDTDKGHFSGDVFFHLTNVEKQNMRLEYTTDTVVNPNTQDPDELDWSAQIPEDLEAVTGVRASWDPPSGVQKKKGFNVFFTGFTVDDDVKADTEVWTWGAVHTRDERGWRTPAWKNQHDATDVGASATTNGLRDVVFVAPSLVSSTTEFKDTVLEQNQTGVVTVGGSLEARPGWDGHVRVTSRIAPGLEYVGSQRKPDQVVKNDDGSTTLVWEKVPAESRSTFTWPVTVRALGAENKTAGFTVTTTVTNMNPNAAGSKHGREATSTDDVTIVTDGMTEFVKTASQAVTVAGAEKEQQWKMTVVNNDDVPQQVTDVIDILPRSGDVKGSKFHGSTRVRDVRVVGDVKDARILYTTADLSGGDYDPQSEKHGGVGTPSKMWSETKPDADDITGVRVITGELPVGETYHVLVDWVPVGNRPGDTYVNFAGARATNTELLMLRSAQTGVKDDGSELKVDKSLPVDDARLAAGETIRYEIQARNASDNPAYKVLVTDAGGAGLVPESVKILEPSAGEARGRIWNVGTLEPHETVTAVVEARVSEDWKGRSPVSNRVVVENPSNTPGGECEPNEGVENDTDQCDTVHLDEDSELQVDKIVTEKPETVMVEGKKTLRGPGVDTAQVTPGETVYFRVQARNNATLKKGSVTTASNVRVTDVADKHLENITILDVEKGRVKDHAVWDIGTLAPGETVTAWVKATVSDDAQRGESLVNRVRVFNPPNPPGTDECEENTGDVVTDTDQCDTARVTPPDPSDPPKQGGLVPKTGGEVDAPVAPWWLAGVGAALLSAGGGSLLWWGRKKRQSGRNLD